MVIGKGVELVDLVCLVYLVEPRLTRIDLMNQINQTNKTNQLFDSLSGFQREIDRLAFPFEQQEYRMILGQTRSGLFIGFE